MIKLTKWMLISIGFMLIIVGCGNDTDSNDQIDSGNDETIEEPVDDIEDEDEEGLEVEAPDPEDEIDEGDDSTEDNSDANDDLLGLGETGVVETALGNIEVTPTEIRFEEEMEEEDPYQWPDNGAFVIVDVTITNIDDETITSDEVITARLHNEDGSGGMTFYEFDSITNFEEEIEPGESYDGELLFDYRMQEAYQFSFGSTHLDELSNEVRWLIETEDAE